MTNLRDAIAFFENSLKTYKILKQMPFFNPLRKICLKTYYKEVYITSFIRKYICETFSVKAFFVFYIILL